MSSLQGFEAVSPKRRSGKAVMTVTNKGIRLNKYAVAELEAPKFVKFLINNTTRQIAVMPVPERDANAIPFGLKPSISASAHIYNPRVIESILRYFDMPEGEGDEIPTVALRGLLTPEGNALVFDVAGAKVSLTRKRGRKPRAEKTHADVNLNEDGDWETPDTEE
ncbi:hypothetical protein [Bifidobacterium gallicum]|uniref:Uncharacterized protein n=1 Tax=Bifidobacterium gallicum DSM 20093 = LMG 11596 TaxID=561180 RepID=D1NRS0_9BIFI|nr:hypothetical protein [Bifidobacterium gallicum]EFA23909.1 hypothetical protein BIFGAL_03019 [Bifidobacterium gallicum DSM 20093 = LMG 11596]KFI59113.1 hypothetical protein BGLCM_0699 [Bifidobacterium gallicum DSM 20093 = LMG 11596]